MVNTGKHMHVSRTHRGTDISNWLKDKSVPFKYMNAAGMTDQQIVEFERECYAYNQEQQLIFNKSGWWQNGFSNVSFANYQDFNFEVGEWRLCVYFEPAKFVYGMTDVDIPAGWTFGYQLKYKNGDGMLKGFVIPYKVDLFNTKEQAEVAMQSFADEVITKIQDVRTTGRLKFERQGSCNKCGSKFPMVKQLGVEHSLVAYQPWSKFDLTLCVDCV